MVCEVEGVEVDWCLGLAVCLLFFRCLWFLRVFREAVSVALLPITSYSVEPRWCCCCVGEWSVVCGSLPALVALCLDCPLHLNCSSLVRFHQAL